MPKRIVFAAILFPFVAWTAGCESVAEPTIPEPVDTTYQGEWAGTTEQGLTVFFTVTGNSITSFGIDIQKTVNDNPVNTSYSLSEIANISNRSFSVQAKAPDPGQPSFTADWVNVSGTFSSATATQGSAANQANQIPATSWTAEKK